MRRPLTLLVLATLSGLAAWSWLRDGPGGPDPVRTPPLPASPLPWFVDASSGSGLVHPTVSGTPEALWVAEVDGQGIALFDYDGDGWLDIYQPGGAVPEEARAGRFPPDRLYRNLGNGRFEETTDAAGLAGASWSFGASAVDYDGDGDLDLHVTNLGQDHLWRNEGDGTFQDLAELAGLVEDDYGSASAWGDVDGDGDLDAYIAVHVQMDLTLRHPPADHDGSPCVRCGPMVYPRRADRLFLNDGQGGFSDVSAESGIRATDTVCFGFQPVMLDVDLDGDPDIFVANDLDRSPNFLFINDGRGLFREEAATRGVRLSGEGDDQACMGIAVFDLDGDGLPELGVTNLHGQYNTLYRNLGGGRFEDISRRAGWAEPSFALEGWGLGVYDFDHDGHLDLLVNNGHLHRHSGPRVPFAMNPLLLRGLEGERFEPVGATDVPGDALALLHSGRGAAFGDLDNDGDVDAVFVRMDEPPALLINRAGDGRPALSVHLQGRPPNTQGIGARVRVEAAGRHWWRYVIPHQSYQSTSDARVHVGLAGHPRVDRVTVYWPDGSRDEVLGAEAGELTVRQGRGRTAWKPHGKGW